MSRVITTAGRAKPQEPRSARREAIAKIRTVLRDTSAQDADIDDALEALTELAKSDED